MRILRFWSRVFAIAVLACAAATASVVPFNGSLAIQFDTLGAFDPPPIGVTGSGNALVNGSGGGTHLASLDLAGGTFATANLVLPITDPAGAPLFRGLVLTVANGSGAFAGNPLAGAMPLAGSLKACLFAPCSAAVANLEVPLSVVGAGGSATVMGGGVDVTVVGAPWTTATAAVGTLTRMGFARGPASNTSSTALASGTVQLVTPIFVSTNIPASPAIGAFGVLTLHFVPEPGTLALLLLGIAGFATAAHGRSRAG